MLMEDQICSCDYEGPQSDASTSCPQCDGTMTDHRIEQYKTRIRGYNGDKLLRHVAMARETLYDDDYRREALEAELRYRLSF